MLLTRSPAPADAAAAPGMRGGYAGASLVANAILVLGSVALALPTMIDVATVSWSTDQGGHGPLVLVSGLWLLWREAKRADAELKPGNRVIGLSGLVAMLLLFVVTRITGILEVEAFVMYGAVLFAAYLLVGGEFLRAIWFPLVYMAFSLPPPETVVAAVTQPAKIWISESAVTLLHGVGYPIASSGVTIQIAQYELLVAAACAGLNSLVTLGALCTFYVYLRHGSNPMAFALMCTAVIPVAIFANFVRVLVLILVTYHLGDAAAQGFLHDVAGLLLFAVALVTILALDKLASPFVSRFASRKTTKTHLPS